MYIVDDASSKLGWSLETTETIDADHRDMVRGPGVKQISEVVKSMVQEAMSSTDARLGT